MGITDLIARRVLYPLWMRRDDKNAARTLRVLERRQFDTPVVIAARQMSALRRVLRHAAETVPYYRQAFASVPVDAIRTLDDLRRLPMLSKDAIRAAGDGLGSDRYRNVSLTRKSTSGSTGVPLRIDLDTSGLRWKRACTLRADEWSGWRRGEPVAKLWGNPDYRHAGWKGVLRNALYERAIHLDTLKMNDAALRAFAAKLLVHRPTLLFGHAHSLYLFADYLERQRLPVHKPRGIISTAMSLPAHQRQQIEAVFGCKVTDRYGCEEVSLIACECAEHRGMHINADSVLVELIAGDRPAKPGEAGKVVVTDLSNLAMPLIRYQVGDMAIASDRICPCGRGLPLIESVQGREADYVVTASGEWVSGISLTENFAVLVPGVKQLQIEQMAVDDFVLRIAPDGSTFGDASRAKIAALVAERFGSAARHAVELVERIPQEASGKYRFCISRVAQAGRPAA